MAELERLKAEVSLERLAEACGVELRRHGPDLIGLCPFHEDHEPSLLISPQKNLWHCMGACQAGGSVIDWVMRDRGVSFRHAVELLRDLPFAAELPRRGATVRTLAAPVTPNADDAELLRQVVAYYHATFTESPEAQAYLEQRGLLHGELADTFQLGFANRTLGLRLPLANRKAGADIRSRLQRLGIIRESGHEHFNGSLVVPIVDSDGLITEAYGRKITPNLRPGTPLHLYLPGPHRGVWNEAALAVSEEVILCEALLDAMTFWCHGLHHVTSAYGVEGFTDDHLAALQRHQVKRVLIAYDRDAAGDRAAVQLAVRLVAAGIDAHRVQFPHGEDVNSFACSDLSTAADRLAERVRKAVWLGQGSAPSPPTANDSEPAAKASAPSLFLGRPRRTQLRAPRDSVGAAASMSLPLFAADAEAVHAATAESDVPLASPLPPAAVGDTVQQGEGDELLLHFGDRRWRIRGLDKVTSFDLLRVNVLVSRDAEPPAFHVDTLDLYSARQRAVFCKSTSDELCVAEDVIRRELGRVLLCCEERAQERIHSAMAPKQHAVALSDTDEAAALELLRDPSLVERILADLDACGIVGEETNKLVAYLAVVSRKLERPLAVVVQSSSAAGKSALLEGVLALVPEEERVKYSALTGQSLFYMDSQQLTHKVLALMEEEGAERAAYALKLLQSEGELSIASTGKDPQSGRLVTHEYRVTGPVAILLTTTAVDVDEELLNRCLLLSVDEEREQTRAIHARQREAETLQGLLQAREREHVITLHRNAQRLLRPLLVVNPYAPQLRFLDSRTRTRRDHTKYLTLIRAITLLHQYQRERRTTTHRGEVVTYIEVTAEDIALANRLADSVLGRSLDELPPQTRRLLTILDGYVRTQQDDHGLQRDDVRVTRRALRESCGWGDTQLRLHLARLCELEHVIAHRDGRTVRYELTWDGRGADGAPALSGLIDPAELHTYDAQAAGSAAMLPGSDAESAGQMRGGNGVDAGQVRGARDATNRNGHNGVPSFAAVTAPESTDTDNGNGAVVPTEAVTPSAAEARRHAVETRRGRRSHRHAGHAPRHQRLRRGAARGQLQHRHGAASRRLPHLVRRLAGGARHHPAERGDQAHPGALPARPVPPHKGGRPAADLRLAVHAAGGGAHLFRWLARQNRILYNPASELELPRLERRLPKHVLSVAEVEAVLSQADPATAMGLRDRAIMEVLYSTGLRRMELIGLSLYDLDSDRGTVMVRQGKGKKDRMVPIGERAILWCERYLVAVRPLHVLEPDSGTLFLTAEGSAFTPNRLTALVRGYIDSAALGKRGSCHLFRHTCATLMLEGGADIRFIQQLLGHADLSTTQIYTQVSIRQLQQVHRATHPAAVAARTRDAGLEEPAAATAATLAAELAREAADEDEHDHVGAAS